jgi:hypothetical protein
MVTQKLAQPLLKGYPEHLTQCVKSPAHSQLQPILRMLGVHSSICIHDVVANYAEGPILLYLKQLALLPDFHISLRICGYRG